MSTALSHGLLILLDRLMFSLRPTADRAIDWLRDVAEPPPGLELRSTDGALYTGLAAFERNKVVFMLAVRAGEARTNTFQQTSFQSPASPAPSPTYQRRYEFDEPDEAWPDSPYSRHR